MKSMRRRTPRSEEPLAPRRVVTICPGQGRRHSRIFLSGMEFDSSEFSRRRLPNRPGIESPRRCRENSPTQVQAPHVAESPLPGSSPEPTPRIRRKPRQQPLSIGFSSHPRPRARGWAWISRIRRALSGKPSRRRQWGRFESPDGLPAGCRGLAPSCQASLHGPDASRQVSWSSGRACAHRWKSRR
jgi:hypothetical protein